MTEDDAKAAYLKAQKQRNLVIGLALLGFVALVFFVSMVRMSQGAHNTVVARQKAMQAMSASAASLK